MRLLIIVGAALAGVLLFLLATASGNTTLFAQHYPLLLGLNAARAGLVAALVAWQMQAAGALAAASKPRLLPPPGRLSTSTC